MSLVGNEKYKLIYIFQLETGLLHIVTFQFVVVVDESQICPTY